MDAEITRIVNALERIATALENRQTALPLEEAADECPSPRLRGGEVVSVPKTPKGEKAPAKGTKPEEPAPSKATPAPEKVEEPAKAEEPVKAESVVTADMIRATVVELAKAGKQAVWKQLLADLGKGKLSEIPEVEYAAVLAKLKKA